MLIDGFEHAVKIPTSPQDGQPQGKRVHSALTVTKETDEASPLLYLALKQGERCKVVLKWYRQEANTEQHYFTTELENALVVNIEPFFPIVFDKATAEYGHMEKVSFTYSKIMWTHEVEGKASEDDWLVAE